METRTSSPLVSVIIPTFNRARLVCRAIESVTGQSYRNLQMIVVDDASSDETGKVVDGLDDARVSYIRHAENKGLAAARNTGIGNAVGEYVAFLDDDDEWLPHKLATQVEYMQNNRDIDAVYCGHIAVYEGGQGASEERWPTGDTSHSGLLRENHLLGATSSMLVKRGCFERVGKFDETLPSCEDWDMWIRLSKDFRIGTNQALLLRRYEHDECMSRKGALMARGREMVLRKNMADIARDRKLLARHYYLIGCLYCSGDMIGQGREYFGKAVRNDPSNLRYVANHAAAVLGYRSFARIVEMRRSRA